MKKLMALLLSLVTVLSMTWVAFAGEMPVPSNTYPAEYEYFDDGSYIVTTITEEPAVSFARATSTKTASKTATYKSSSGASLWSATVTGTFSYNGSSAKCTAVTGRASSNSSYWKVSSLSCSKLNTLASATATSKQYDTSWAITRSVSRTVTLSCSASGKLS